MIVIFSQQYEQTTGDVINWLNYLGGKFLRINQTIHSEVKVEGVIGDNEQKITFQDDFEAISLNAISAIWFRRPDTFKLPNDIYYLGNQTRHEVLTNLSTEESGVRMYIESVLRNKYWLNSRESSVPSKPFQLLLATEIGLKIPTTLVTSSKTELTQFKAKHDKIIVKPIRDMRPINYNGKNYMQFVNIVDDSFIKKLSDTFIPCLAQRCISKKYEIRAFFLEEKVYSMAMFTQADSQTSVDFRFYNDKKPTRRVPYQLPQEIESKIIIIAKKLGLNSGSVDIIYSTEKEYIFLEINPIGQFGMTSYPCNYYLEREVALLLMSKKA